MSGEKRTPKRGLGMDHRGVLKIDQKIFRIQSHMNKKGAEEKKI